MKISVASGKGGTGKTLVTVSLFKVLKERLNPVLVDIDVECPDAALFIKDKQFTEKQKVYAYIPLVDSSKCNLCGLCVSKCNYKAIGIVGDKVTIFKELCKSCLRCINNCPTGAMSKIDDETGSITTYKSGNNIFIEGLLKSGEIRTAYLIKSTKRYAEKNNPFIIYDCPPGTTCPMVNAVSGTDYCIVVAEDSPFGYSDFKLAVEVLRDMGIDFGVVINKYKEDKSEVEDFCNEQSIRILAKIPYSTKIHEIYSVAGDPLTISDVSLPINKVADYIEKELLCTK